MPRPQYSFAMGFQASQDRYNLLERIFKLFSVIGLIAYIPALLACIADGFWLTAIIDTLMYALIVAFAFVFHPRFEVKLALLIASALAVGAAAIITAGQYSIGYIWLLVAVILSALFGQVRMIVVTLSAAILIVVISGLALVFSGDNKGMTLKSVVVIATSLLVVSILLVLIIHRLISGLSDSLAESSRLARRLSDELKESNDVRQKLQANLITEERLRRELQHRVRNNLQVVLSLMSSSGEPGHAEEPCLVSAKRRIRVLAAVNDVYLSSEGTSLIDAYNLIRSVVQRSNAIAVDRIGSQGKAVLTDAAFSPQVASIAAVILSDIMAAFEDQGIETRLCLNRVKGCIRVEIQPLKTTPDHISLNVFNKVMVDRIAAGAAPDITIGLLASIDPSLQGLYLDTRIG